MTKNKSIKDLLSSLTILFCFFSCTINGQSINEEKLNLSFTKSKTFTVETVQKIDSSFFKFDNKNTIIYIPFCELKKVAKKYIQKHPYETTAKQTLVLLDSISLKNDTTEITYIPNRQLISDLLITGKVKVYSKREKSYVKTFTYCVARFATMFERVFYLPNKTPFYIHILIDKPGLAKEIKAKSKTEQTEVWSGLKISGQIHREVDGF